MGQIIHSLRISSALPLIEHTNAKLWLDERCELLLSLLPKGSKILDIMQVPLDMEHGGLSAEYRIFLEHPLFKDGSTVELKQVWTCWVDPNRNFALQTDTIVTKVTYLDPDGKEMFA